MEVFVNRGENDAASARDPPAGEGRGRFKTQKNGHHSPAVDVGIGTNGLDRFIGTDHASIRSRWAEGRAFQRLSAPSTTAKLVCDGRFVAFELPV